MCRCYNNGDGGVQFQPIRALTLLRQVCLTALVCNNANIRIFATIQSLVLHLRFKFEIDTLNVSTNRPAEKDV